MSLRDAAINNFKPERIFELTNDHAVDFVSLLEDYGHRYGYLGLTSHVATNCQIDPADPNNITLLDLQDILNSFGVVSGDHVERSATLLWGNKTWTITPKDQKNILVPTPARGELTPNGRALTDTGKSLMLRRFHSSILAAQTLAMIGELGRNSLRVDRKRYEWSNPTTGEVVQDGLMVCFLVLQHMRPSVNVSVFLEIAKMQKIKAADYKYNVCTLNTEMGKRCVQISMRL